MKKITTRQFVQSLPSLEQLLAKEREVIVTRRGQPRFRLLPVEKVTGKEIKHNANAAF